MKQNGDTHQRGRIVTAMIQDSPPKGWERALLWALITFTVVNCAAPVELLLSLWS
jgi:hypothetical protein